MSPGKIQVQERTRARQQQPRNGPSWPTSTLCKYSCRQCLSNLLHYKGWLLHASMCCVAFAHILLLPVVQKASSPQNGRWYPFPASRLAAKSWSFFLLCTKNASGLLSPLVPDRHAKASQADPVTPFHVPPAMSGAGASPPGLCIVCRSGEKASTFIQVPSSPSANGNRT